MLVTNIFLHLIQNGVVSIDQQLTLKLNGNFNTSINSCLIIKTVIIWLSLCSAVTLLQF